MSQGEAKQQGQEAKRKEEEQAEGRNIHLIHFSVGKEQYAVTIDQVREVVLTPKITALPMAPDYVLGVANVRGDILAMVDINKRLKAKMEEKADQTRFTLVLESDQQKVGVVVNEMPGTIVVPESSLEDAPSFSENEEAERWVKNIVNFEDQLYVLIDLQKLTNSREIAEAYSIAVSS